MSEPLTSEAEGLFTVLRQSVDPETAAAYLQAVPPEQQWHGLDRYWRKREQGS